MINALQGVGYGIIGLAVMIGIGTTVLFQLGSTISSCPTGYTYNGNSTSANLCVYNTNNSNTVNPATATQTVNTVTGYLGTSSGGLASWIPVIIVLVIGMLFLGAFMSRKGKTYS